MSHDKAKQEEGLRGLMAEKQFFALQYAPKTNITLVHSFE